MSQKKAPHCTGPVRGMIQEYLIKEIYNGQTNNGYLNEQQIL